jgi:S-adenosylmethionine decarboxylase
MAERKGNSTGYHVLIDLQGVPNHQCNDDDFLLNVLVQAATLTNVRIINTLRYHFGHMSHQGCSVIVMLDESHITAHTYANEGLAAIDIFVCGKQAKEKTRLLCDHILDCVEHKSVKNRSLGRFV